jgi:hypothetical protein
MAGCSRGIDQAAFFAATFFVILGFMPDAFFARYAAQRFLVASAIRIRAAALM